MTEALPPVPDWTRYDAWEWGADVHLGDGTLRSYAIVKNNFRGTDRGRRTWYVLEAGEDPFWLADNIRDAKDEFLLLIVHGWIRPFGYVDGDVNRPIYGKGSKRRERAEVLAEIKAAYRAQRKAVAR